MRSDKIPHLNQHLISIIRRSLWSIISFI